MINVDEIFQELRVTPLIGLICIKLKDALFLEMFHKERQQISDIKHHYYITGMSSDFRASRKRNLKCNVLHLSPLPSPPGVFLKFMQQ